MESEPSRPNAKYLAKYQPINSIVRSAGRRMAQPPCHTGANHRPHHPAQRRRIQQRMDRIRSCSKAPRHIPQDVAELPRPAPHPLLSDRPQNLRQPRRPRHLSPTASNPIKKIAINPVAIGCVLRHNRLPSQKFFVTLHK